jgi:hypothetical protein
MGRPLVPGPQPMDVDSLSKKRKLNEIAPMNIPMNPKNKVRRLNDGDVISNF